MYKLGIANSQEEKNLWIQTPLKIDLGSHPARAEGLVNIYVYLYLFSLSVSVSVSLSLSLLCMYVCDSLTQTDLITKWFISL